MNDKRTRPLQLDEQIVTGNTKAAVKAAGGKSADLWMVPYDQIHYDPRDNVRPLDTAWAKHIGNLIAADGYDKSQPLHCYVRKVDGEDRIYVWKGQHRYHGIGYAMKDHGADVGLIPAVILDAKSVKRVNLIFSGLTSNESKKTSPLELAEKIAELRDVHGVDSKVICERLQITDQTIRDVALLETAPAALHKLVREGTVAGTLAIGEIRAHGPAKALERLQAAVTEAKTAGKGKATKKHVAKAAAASPVPKKISEPQAKSLLQALQAVLHDPIFGKLSPGTIAGVHAALSPLTDLLDLPAKKHKYPISKPNVHGVYLEHETIRAPWSKRVSAHPGEIHLAQIAPDKWVSSTSYRMGDGGGSTPCSWHEGEPTYPTRGQAVRGAVREFTRRLEDPRLGKSKEAPSVRAWLDKLWAAPDPDWTEDLAKANEIAGLNDVVFVDELTDPVDYPIHATLENGVFEDCETIAAPVVARGTGGLPAAEIHLAHAEPGKWVYEVGYHFAKAGISSYPSLGKFTRTYPSRFKAIEAACQQLVEHLEEPGNRTERKRFPVLNWIQSLLAQERKKLEDLARGAMVILDTGSAR